MDKIRQIWPWCGVDFPISLVVFSIEITALLFELFFYDLSHFNQLLSPRILSQNRWRVYNRGGTKNLMVWMCVRQLDFKN